MMNYSFLVSGSHTVGFKFFFAKTDFVAWNVICQHLLLIITAVNAQGRQRLLNQENLAVSSSGPISHESIQLLTIPIDFGTLFHPTGVVVFNCALLVVGVEPLEDQFRTNYEEFCPIF